MKRILCTCGLAVAALAAMCGGVAFAAPDCTAENVLGLVWSNDEFTLNGSPGRYQARLCLFNPTGRSIWGFDCRLVLPTSGVYLTDIAYRGEAVNIGTDGEHIVAFRTPQLAVDGVVTLAILTFEVLSADQMDFFAEPAFTLPSVPGRMTVFIDGASYRMDGVSGDFAEPIARLNGPDLPWCTEPYDSYVEIVTAGSRGYYAGTAPEATADFDPAYDLVNSDATAPVWFPAPPGAEQYAFVRHLLSARPDSTVTTTVDGVPFAVPYDRFVALPLGEFCLRECVWNEGTGAYDCRDDCQYAIAGGGFYTLTADPGGATGDLMLVAEEGAFEFKTDIRTPYAADTEMTGWRFFVETTNVDEVPVPATVRFLPSFADGQGIALRLWDETAQVLHDLWPTLDYAYEVPAGTTDTREFVLYVGTPLYGDTDGDGVPDVFDACPVEDASFFDSDGDGCIDPVAGGRHVEYWARGTFPLEYLIHAEGAPGITDGSDLVAIQEGFAAWSEVAGAEVSVSYLGTTPDGTADALDLVNTVTFADDDYLFPSGVIAVGLSTSYVEPDYVRGYRPGQIIDTDMIFNPNMSFRTATQGSGVDLESIVVHEAGHMLGLSHSAVQTSTMFYVLPPDTTGASLAAEDRQTVFKAYPDTTVIAGASHLQGRVINGWTGEPLAGAIVFVMDAVSRDTLACDFTLPANGSYHFVGLPDGTYDLAIHPLNGSSAIGYLQPGNINALIKGTAETLFVPEYWDAEESSADDPTVATPVFVVAGQTTTADFVTNIDLTGPSVIAVSPGADATDVAIDTAILFRCDEAIDGGSLVGNFNFAPAAGGGLLAGSASLVEDGRTLAYVPSVNLEFATDYVLEVGPGVTDIFGNPMGTVFTMQFTTQVEPAVALDNLLPRKGVAGSIVVINGAGFSSNSGDNNVTFGGEPIPLLEAAPGQLVIQIPESMVPTTALLEVQRVDTGAVSNPLSFTVLPPGDEARGLETALVDLFALPRRIEIAPDGDHVYIATNTGLAGVDVRDPANPSLAALALGLGTTDLDVTPDGQRIYAVGREDRMLHRIQAEPFAALGSLPLAFQPRGILVGPSGRRAYMTTASREIQVWDINESSTNFQRQIGSLLAPAANLVGPLATDPAGNYLLVLASTGQVLVFDLATLTLVDTTPVVSTARDIVVDPLGERAYVTGDDGYVSFVSLTTFNNILDLPVGGGLLGAAIDPMGSLLYVVDHQLDDLTAVDLRRDSPTYRTISARLPQRVNPVDVAVSPDGVYAYTIVESDRQLAVTAVGTGPVLGSLSRRAGPVGSKVVLAGADFTGATVSFAGVPVPVERGDDTSLAVTVPAGVVSGPVVVAGVEPGEVSSPIRFEVLTASPAGGLRRAATLRPDGLPALSGLLAVTANDRLAVAGGEDGRLHVLDIDPASGDFTRFVGASDPLAGPVAALAVSPDGLSAFAVHDGTSAVSQFNINPGSASFGGLIATIPLDGAAPTDLALGPDGRCLLVADPVAFRVHVVDRQGTAVVVTDLAGAVPRLNGSVGAMVFHPGGQWAYLTVADSDPAVILVLDTDPASGTFAEIVGSVAVPGPVPDAIPVALSFAPDGGRCVVLVGPQTAAGSRALVVLGSADPLNPQVQSTIDLPTAAAPMRESLQVAPAGDRVLVNIRDDGFHLVNLATGGTVSQPDLVADGAPLGFGFAPDGSRVFVAASASDDVGIFDFNDQQRMAKVWGDNQTGRVDLPLGTSLRVRVTDPTTGAGLAGVPVTFTIVPPAGNEPAKGTDHVGANPGTPDADKSGGETFETAVPIAALPFFDTGNTCDNADDYDESCPFASPGSPDVVYTWTADFSGGVDIDLCGSGYDTKLFVYEEVVTPGSPWACNDDFYATGDRCGDFVSRITGMGVTEGLTYIIVVDGFAGDCGDYAISVRTESVSTPTGFFVTADPNRRPPTLTVGSGPYGYAEVVWNLGASPGTQAVTAGAAGTIGSPLQFVATAVEDPNAVPFMLLADIFRPAADATGVDVATAIQATFSKPVDPATVTAAQYSLVIAGGATPVPVVIGLANGNLTASLTPVNTLAYGTTYQVRVGSGIRGAKGEPLTNPTVLTFATAAPPPAPVLTAVTAPAAAAQVGVVISGSGFDPLPAQNIVRFNGVTAPVLEVAPDFIRTRVPLGAETGSVEVQTRGVTSNSLAFTVLVPTTDGADDVLARVPTGSSTRSVTVSPDGARLYAVSPEADLVVPINLEDFSTEPGIPVGDLPWSIDSHPDGSFAYVANRASDDVSVIDIVTGSSTYNQVVQIIDVGDEPVELVVTPDGDRVIVANSASSDLSVIDSDMQSASFNQVLSRVPVGSGAKSVTVSPDGAFIYVGTEIGYVVFGAVDYGVLRTVPTGSGVKSVTVSPDGALLVIVDTQGEVLIFDVAPGSPTQDQVLARVPTGSGVRSATVSPDGARLYVVMEENDVIQVYALDVGTSIGARADVNTTTVLELELLETLTAGENPESITFDPSGALRFFVPNAGDNTVTVFDLAAPEGVLTGVVAANCPEPGTPLAGVELDVFANATQELAASLVTDETGTFTTSLAAGDYTAVLITPFGYTVVSESAPVTVVAGGTARLDWTVYCEYVTAEQRKLSFWLHEVILAILGVGEPQIGADAFCGYLDVIEAHFSNNALNRVSVYDPPESDLCADKLAVAYDLLNPPFGVDMLGRARQELMALLLNVASDKLSLREVISRDGAVVTQAITYVDHLIDDGDPANDELAMQIAKDINKGKLINANVIPPDIPNIFYAPAARVFHLDQNYPNPFNPEAMIRFGIPRSERVQLRIYDVAGRLVRTLVDEPRNAGTYVEVWNGTDDRGRSVSSGIYFYKLEAGTFRQVRKMTMLK